MNTDLKEIDELPDGWVLCRSKSNPGKQYYFHRKTGKSSWTRPQLAGKLDTKGKKKESPSQSQEKRKNECSKSVKRKSDGTAADSSEKKQKNETPETYRKKKILKATGRKTQNNNTASLCKKTLFKKSPSKCNNLLDQSPKCQSLSDTQSKHTSLDQSTSKCTPFKSPPKRQSLNHSFANRKSLNDRNTTPTKNKTAEQKVSPIKNLASNRLSQLRARLSVEALNEDNNEPASKKNKSSLTPTSHGTPASLNPESLSPIVNKPVHSTPIKSPSNNTFLSTPSQTKFIIPEKVNCSTKPFVTNHHDKEESKEVFANKQPNYSQTKQSPIINPSTSLFSEPATPVSTISNTIHTPKEVKTFSSAKERMEALRASISGDIDEQDLQDNVISNCHMPLTPPDIVMPLEPQTPPKCEAMEVEDIKDLNEQLPMQSSDQMFTFQSPSSLISPPKEKVLVNGPVVLVVDTNIFIHELNIIKNALNSHIEGYSGQPTLLVPWRVITELDHLKDSSSDAGRVAKRARAAMDFLYKALPEDTRIKGQSLRDANFHIYPCETPDDEILNCALQQVERGNNVLLLSNDRNLCVKAAANGVSARGAAALAAGAERVRAERVRRCERALQPLLASILESEMRAKYEELWQRVVHKPPPWRLSDAVQGLLRHWRAVFAEALPGLEAPLTGLRASLARIEDKDPNSLTEAELSKFSELCLEVARKCQIVPEYMHLAKLTVERLVRGESETHGATCDVRASETHGATRDVRASETHGGTHDATRDVSSSETQDAGASETVVAAFESLWLVVSSYSAKLATSLGVAHCVEDKLPNGEACDLEACRSSVARLVLALDRILDARDVSDIKGKTFQLHAAFDNSLRLARSENRLTRQQLEEFCVKNRNMLREALNKFSQLARLLDSCRDNLSRPAH